MTNRRNFFLGAGAAGLFVALRGVRADVPEPPRIKTPTGPGYVASPFGPSRPDPGRLLDLPDGFEYRIVSRANELMDDGLLVPGSHDGMAAFDVGRGRVALVCNHELSVIETHKGPFGADGEHLGRIRIDKLFDPGRQSPSLGGTTTLVYDQRTGRKERHFLSLAGTERNCAGGPTPWGSWLSCEESVAMTGEVYARDHGWVFEVPADARGPVDPVPLEALGRFNHEAAAVDPATGVLYLTEDRGDGLLYRLLPAKPGDLAAGGRLQALALSDWDGSADTRNWPRTGNPPFPQGESLSARWVDLDDTHAPNDDLRMRGAAAGAAIFARGEGIWFGNGDVYFACTSGGALEAGQIFRYTPSPQEGSGEAESPGMIELFVESTDRRLLDNADNLTVSPWGDLIVCEDADSGCSLVGVTPEGGLYRFAKNAYGDSELAGVCFAPNGRTMFVNVQKRGLTLAIEGPFPDTR